MQLIQYPTFAGWVFPATILEILTKDLKLDSVLDVGGGTAVLATDMWRQRISDYKRIVLDIWLPCLKRDYLPYGWHRVCGDGAYLPFKSKSIDMVECSEVIEHLDRERGWLLLEELKRVARVFVFMTSPRGFKEQPPIDNNPFQIHKSGWMPEDYEKVGFQVEGNPPPIAPACQLIVWKDMRGD